MKTSTVAVIVFFLFIAVMSENAGAENAPLTVYRDQSGQLTPASRAAVRDMLGVARQQGYITLWLTADVYLNLYLDDQRQIDAQAAAIRARFEEILDPLVRRRAVWHPEDGPYISGPGCLVRANISGLMRLVHDERILQIVAVP